MDLPGQEVLVVQEALEVPDLWDLMVQGQWEWVLDLECLQTVALQTALDKE